MSRILLVLPLLVLASAASAQQGREACTRDATRYCRAQLNDGDQVVLACLKQHRGRLSKACRETLASHGE